MPNAASLIAQAGTNRFMLKALTSWPDYARLVALRTKVVQHQRTLTPVPQVLPPTNEDADLDAWLTDVAQAANAQRDIDVQAGALAELLRNVDAGITAIAEVHTETLLESLAADLTGLMRDVEAVVIRLDGATTPAEAIANGTAAAWRQLPPLRDEYDDLRDAQLTIVQAADFIHVQNAQSPHIDDDGMASDLALANLDQLLPGWRRPAPAHFSISSAPPPDRRPWPADPIEQLVWMVASDAQPWVPTLAQLYQLHESRRAKDNPVAPGGAKDMQDRTLLNKPLVAKTIAESV